MNLHPVFSAKRKYEWKKAVGGIFFPRRLCANCGKPSPGDILCPACRKIQQQLRPCPCCATWIAATEAPDYRCGNCRRQKPFFTSARAALPYDGYLRQSLIRYKFYGQTGYRRVFGALLVDMIQREWADISFDLVIPIPLHPKREQERGYNQTAFLAEIISFELDIPFSMQGLIRQKETKALSQLKGIERAKEIHHAFAVGVEVKDKIVLLVDDIYTTGSTCREAAKTLLAAGAKAVYVAAVASGQDGKSKPTEKKESVNP